MNIEVRESGVVRLLLQDWKDIVDSTDLPPELREIPGAAEAVDAARRPVVKMALEVGGPASTGLHVAAVSADAAALLMHVKGAVYQLMPMPPTFLAGGLAELIRLRPHRQDADRPGRTAAGDLMEQLLTEEDSLRTAAFKSFDLQFAWRLSVVTATDRSRVSGVFDPGGHATVHIDDAGSCTIKPVSNTVLWRLLSGLLKSILPNSEGGQDEPPGSAKTSES